MPEFYAYAHLKPDLTPFHVGKGSGHRYRDFINGRNQHHKNIVAKYGRENIIIEVMPCKSEAEAFLREQLAIKALRASGIRLTNQTDGGEGAAGAVRSEAFKANLSKPRTPEVRARISAATRGLKRSAEARAKLIGNKRNLGNKHSDETKLKMSISAKARWSRSKNA